MYIARIRTGMEHRSEHQAHMVLERSDEKTDAIAMETANDVVNKINATFGLIQSAASSATNIAESHRVDVVRGVIGIFDVFREQPNRPIFDIVVALFGGVEQLKPVQILEKLARVVIRFDDRTLTLRELTDKLATALGVKMDTSLLQKHFDVIEKCSRCMEEFLENITSDEKEKYKKEFVGKINEVETVLNQLMLLVVGERRGAKSIIDAHFDNCGGRIKHVSGLAYIILVTMFRALVCQQVRMVYDFGQAVWEQLLLTMKMEFEECHRSLTNALRRCRDKVGDNIERDFRRGIKTTKWEKLWQKLLFDYKAIVDLRYLEVDVNPRSRSGWDNTVIYRAQFVKYVYHELPDVKPARGVLLFYWLIEDSDRKTCDMLKCEIPVVVDQIPAACIAGSRTSAFKSRCAANPRVQYEFQYLAGLATMPSNSTLTCLILVADFATGCYRSGLIVNVSRTVKEFKYQSGKWKFSGGTSTNGSISAKFSWPGASGIEHNGVVCIARRKVAHVEAFVEMTMDQSTAKCCECPLKVTILKDEDCLNSIIGECNNSDATCTLI